MFVIYLFSILGKSILILHDLASFAIRDLRFGNLSNEHDRIIPANESLADIAFEFGSNMKSLLYTKMHFHRHRLPRFR